MLDNQVQQGSGDEGDEEEVHYLKFYVSQEEALDTGRSLPLMVLNRMGYMEKQAFEDDPDPSDDVQPYIDQIVNQSSKDPDYLLPDTPLKEAIFRVILSNGNEPMDAEEISEILSERWAMTAYPRDVTPKVINRLLENSQSYCIVAIPEPEPEIEEEPVAIEAPAAVEDSSDDEDDEFPED